MARKKQAEVTDKLGAIFKRTDAGAPAGKPGAGTGKPDTADLDAGLTRTVGVGLKDGEIAALEAIAGELGITRNALMRYIVRRWLVDYRAGQIDMRAAFEERTERRLKLP